MSSASDVEFESRKRWSDALCRVLSEIDKSIAEHEGRIIHLEECIRLDRQRPAPAMDETTKLTRALERIYHSAKDGVRLETLGEMRFKFRGIGAEVREALGLTVEMGPGVFPEDDMRAGR